MKPNDFKYLHFLTIALIFIPGCLPTRVSGDECGPAGSGFTRYDPCLESCIDWEISCSDDKKVTPLKCSGPLCSNSSECLEDEECTQIDSFESNNRCMKKSICSD